MLAEGAAVDAAQTFAAILGEDPNHAAAYGGLVRAHIASDDLEQAEAILNGAPGRDFQRFPNWKRPMHSWNWPNRRQMQARWPN